MHRCVCVNCCTVVSTASMSLHLSAHCLTKTSWPKCTHIQLTSNKLLLYHLVVLQPLSPWWWQQQVPQKHQRTPTRPLSISHQNTAVLHSHHYMGLKILDLPHCRSWQEVIPPKVWALQDHALGFTRLQLVCTCNSISKQNMHQMLHDPVLV